MNTASNKTSQIIPATCAAKHYPWAGRELHFIGIGGCGMSGLALIASLLGAKVTGSDQKESIFIASLRQDPSIVETIGHDRNNVPPAAEIVYSSAVREDNPERAFARARGQAELHRSELIAQLTQQRFTVAVAGAHGKTTTSALLAHVLTEARKDPSYIVGGLLRPPAAHARAGQSDILVIEADESDRSLLNFDIDIAVITNVDLDHVGDVGGFSNRADVVTLFRSFLQGVDRVITTPSVAVELGLPEAVVAAPDPRLQPGLFTLKDEVYEINLPGEHNLANASLVVAAALELGCRPDEIRTGLASFPGLKRRFEFRGTMSSGARLFDDYAHHPAEVAAAIAAARSLSTGRIIAVFQPHLFSRTAQFAESFAEALATADLALLDEIYPARETQSAFPDVTSGNIAILAPPGSRVMHPTGEAELLGYVTEAATDPDSIVLLLGAGDVGRLADQLVKEP
ncbi:UDP-N-acetylmuramate--L-alanine ligase [Buchananella hordeovulneris]|uniref:UDP-N-acetylmuramate--L-alanine ligase n=1 Tax=Buchananella hordeovulneris TaxID=52770 RepID=UPI000F5E06F3|nr:Mur ligase domain-containing protein [Buchananella hordeovulneris]RRD43129.1 UDP-N-acetylmuramate--L-alanine ligase [Buchananella hordeovulneris]